MIDIRPGTTSGYRPTPPRQQIPRALQPRPQHPPRPVVPIHPKNPPPQRQRAPRAMPPPPHRNLPVVRRGGGGRLIPAGAGRQTGGGLPPQPPMDPNAVDPEQQFIDASIGPALQQIAYERQQQMQADQQRAAAIHDFTNQFLGYMSGLPGQAQADYNQMLSQQQALGTQAQQALTAANPNSSIQNDLSAIGAPANQSAQVANSLNQAFTGGGAVLQGTGAYIPGNRIARDEAAQLAFLRSLPAISQARGSQIISQQDAASQKALSDLAQQESQVYAGVPKLRLDYQSQLQSSQAKQQQLNLERRALGLKVNNQRFTQKATKVKLGQSQARLNQGAQRLRLSAQNQGVNQNLRYAEVFGYDPKTGRPTLAAIKAAKADRAKRNKPPSATELKNWHTYAENAYYGIPARRHYDPTQAKFLPIPGTKVDAVAYYPALRRLMGMGATLTQAQKVLNAYYHKGEGGRPWVSLQGRMALQRAGMPLRGTNSTPNARQVAYLRKHGLWSD